MQDFWATMYLANLMTSMEYKTDAAIADKNRDKKNTNENRLIDKFRGKFFDCLLEQDEAKRDTLYSELVADIAERHEHVKPGRTAPRKTARKMKFHDRRKAVM